MTLEARVDRLENALVRLAGAQERAAERLGELEARLLEFQLRTEEQFARVEAQIEALTGRVERVEDQIGALTGSLDQLGAHVRSLAERVEDQIGALTREVTRLAGEVGRLVDWQRGEAGRREGEHYEQEISLRAARLLGPGWGGSPRTRPEVLDRINAALEQAALEPDKESDPALADIVWWPGRPPAADTVLVVEVSRIVDSGDVRRAHKRAETLGAAKLRAIAVVIGQDMTPGAEALARDLQVEWYTEAAGPSPGLLELRRKS